MARKGAHHPAMSESTSQPLAFLSRAHVQHPERQSDKESPDVETATVDQTRMGQKPASHVIRPRLPSPDVRLQ